MDLLMQKGPGHRVPPAVGAIEEGVEIGQQSVADGEVVSRGIQQQGVSPERGRILGLKKTKGCNRDLATNHRSIWRIPDYSSQGRAPVLKDPRAQTANFVSDQRSWAKGDHFTRQVATLRLAAQPSTFTP